MSAKGADVFLPLLISMIFVSFMVKKPSFCKPDGISITLNEEDLFHGETFVYSLLHTSNIFHGLQPRRKGLFCLLLLICRDVEQCPGPYNGLIENVTQFCKIKGLKIFSLNIRGWQGNFDELKNLLITSRIDISALN